MSMLFPPTPDSGGQHHHCDAAGLDAFDVMPQVWPIVFGVVGLRGTVAHLTPDAPPLVFRPLSEYRVLCELDPMTTDDDAVVYGVDRFASALLLAAEPASEGEAPTVCTRCRAAFEALTDAAIAVAGEDG